jgi:hypothetical protein
MSPSDFSEHQENIRSEARARAREEIAKRIRRVCQGLTEGEFEALVDRMAGVQCKYEQINGDPTSLHQVLQFLSDRTTPSDKRRKAI